MHRIGRLLLVAFVLVPCVASPQGGNPLGLEFRVNTYTTGDQYRQRVASDSSGNFVVVWHGFQPDGFGVDVFGQRYASTGAPLGPEFRVNTYTTQSQGYPAVASDSSGNFVVVWDDFQDGSGGGVFGQRFASTGAPLGPEFRVNSYTPYSQSGAIVASDASGNFVVVWNSFAQDGSGSGVFGQRFTSTGEPLGPEFRVNTYTAGSQGGGGFGADGTLAVASDASGNFVVVWNSLTQDGSEWGVFGQRYASSGDPLGPEFGVNTYTTHSQMDPAVASDASGNFVVVWESTEGQDGSGNGVFGQRYDSTGTPLGPEFRVNTWTTSGQEDAAVAADASGTFVVAWHVKQNLEGIFGQRYASTGQPLGPEFRVNTYTTGIQEDPAVALDASGNFVVVWRSYGQDGSYSGVFGQRFSRIAPRPSWQGLTDPVEPME